LSIAILYFAERLDGYVNGIYTIFLLRKEKPLLSQGLSLYKPLSGVGLQVFK